MNAAWGFVGRIGPGRPARSVGTCLGGAFWLLCLSLWSLPMVSAAQPVLYSFVPQASFVHFEVLHFNTSTSRGRFGPVQGAVTLDATAQRGELSLRIPSASVDTGLRIFDARLRQADLLASEAHPEVFFVASQFRFEGHKLLEVRGEFTWRGHSQPLSLRAVHFACRDADANDPPGGRICGGNFEGEFNRSDFGATFGLPLVADRVRLWIQVQGQAGAR
jgi:polyisoprenoid-binding protein YceI